MGSYARPPDWMDSGDEADETTAKIGDNLSGRLSDIEIESVEAVRAVRERR